MEAKDLRIGNWVHLHPINGYKEKGLVSAIASEEIYFSCGDSALVGEIEPIPLTEEWLLKFGFEQDEYDANIFNYSIFEYQLSDNSLFNHLCKLTEIKHVHQLQNLYYCLTGDELKIKE